MRGPLGLFRPLPGLKPSRFYFPHTCKFPCNENVVSEVKPCGEALTLSACLTAFAVQLWLLIPTTQVGALGAS